MWAYRLNAYQIYNGRQKLREDYNCSRLYIAVVCIYIYIYMEIKRVCEGGLSVVIFAKEGSNIDINMM